MKKKTIWTIAIIMGFSFLALLFLQLSYIQEMVNMKKEQFDESVNRALYQASRNLELNETLRYLEKTSMRRSARPTGKIRWEHGAASRQMEPYSILISILWWARTARCIHPSS